MVGVGLLTLAVAVLYAAFSLEQHAHLRTSSYDSVIFDQAVRAYAHFRLPVVPVKGVHNDLGANFVLLGDHFSPVLAVLAPLYWLHADVPTLLVAQAVLFAVSVPIVWVFVRRLLGAPAAYLVAVAYALSWGLQSALATDFHEVAFAVPLVALALERVQARRPGQAAVAAALLLLVKEDFGPFVSVFGIYLLLVGWRLGWRRLGLALVVGGLVAFELTTRVFIPFFGGHGFAYWSYSALGPNLPTAVEHVAAHPLDTLRIATEPAVKRHTLWLLFVPWGFLSLGSPIVLLAVPLLAERMLSTNWHYWSTAFHYNAVLMVILALAAVDTLARLLALLRPPGARRRAAVVAAAAFLAASVAILPHFAFRALLSRSEWTTTPTMAAAAQILGKVPDGVTIEADTRLGPHLTSRTHVLLLDQIPRGAPWVVLDVSGPTFPFDNVQQARNRLSYLVGRGYDVVAEAGGFRLLHRR